MARTRDVAPCLVQVSHRQLSKQLECARRPVPDESVDGAVLGCDGFDKRLGPGGGGEVPGERLRFDALASELSTARRGGRVGLGCSKWGPSRREEQQVLRPLYNESQ